MYAADDLAPWNPKNSYVAPTDDTIGKVKCGWFWCVFGGVGGFFLFVFSPQNGEMRCRFLVFLMPRGFPRAVAPSIVCQLGFRQCRSIHAVMPGGLGSPGMSIPPYNVVSREADRRSPGV